MRIRARKAIPIASAVFAFAILGTWGLFAAVRAVFGEAIGAGYHGPAVNLCVLDRDGSAGILIAGDSRAKTQIDPFILAARTGSPAVNVAEAFPFGGDMTTLVNSLRAHPRALADSPLVLISISLLSANDRSLDDQSMPGAWNWSARNHLRLAMAVPGRYLRWMSERFLPSLLREARHRRNGETFACTDEVGLPPAQLEKRGYRPYTGSNPQSFGNDGKGWMIDNGAWDNILRGVEWLERSPARAVILVDAPIWRERGIAGIGREWAEQQDRFGRNAATAFAGRPKVRFLDLSEAPAEMGLDTAHWFDMYHLNSLGAERLSAWLGDWIAREFPRPDAR